MPEYFEFPDSPFKQANIITFPDGYSILHREKIIHTAQVDDHYHLVTEFDTLGAISFKFYGTSKYWWIIADVNGIDHPLILETGNTLIIPKLNNLNGI